MNIEQIQKETDDFLDTIKRDCELFCLERMSITSLPPQQSLEPRIVKVRCSIEIENHEIKVDFTAQVKKEILGE